MSAQISRKRSRNSPPTPASHKRQKMTTREVSAAPASASAQEAPQSRPLAPIKPAESHSEKQVETKSKHRIKKLTPVRPFPSVPTSVSATGPRSAHVEGKNFICITRKTSLGAYMRRCSNLILKDGYKTLHLSAMGAAIPLLIQLSLALPPILPFSSDEVRTEISTGTVEVQDEILPDDEEEDISYRTRGKSTLKIIIIFGDGEFSSGPTGNVKRKRKGKTRVGASEKNPSSKVVSAEPEQVDVEMV
ncbi:hypothetical protein D9757_007222 [Collybiopsis confluens]|uniref:Uncharacterized protein n=1 Tax=Collybiopsis confluens TaxID=2823264 RepID=A0A8H5HAV1_9AGAR|nr:hypothetical protein D9757_007222 [Collybiopsis confluens]